MMKQKLSKQKKKYVPSHIRIDDEVEICVDRPVSIKIEGIPESADESVLEQSFKNENFAYSSEVFVPVSGSKFTHKSRALFCPFKTCALANDNIEMKRLLDKVEYSNSLFENQNMKCNEFDTADAVDNFAFNARLITEPNCAHVDEQPFNHSISFLGKGKNEIFGSKKMSKNICDEIPKNKGFDMEKRTNVQTYSDRKSTNLNVKQSGISPCVSSDCVSHICYKKIKTEHEDHEPSTYRQKTINKNYEKKGKISSSEINMKNKCIRPKNIQTSKRGSREIDQLYKSLQEMSWANDKNFTHLLYSKSSLRPSHRLSKVKAMADKSRCYISKEKIMMKRKTNVSRKAEPSNYNQNQILKPKLRNRSSINTKSSFKYKSNYTTLTKSTSSKVEKSIANTRISTFSKQIGSEKWKRTTANAKNFRCHPKRTMKRNVGKSFEAIEMPNIEIKVKEDFSSFHAKPKELKSPIYTPKRKVTSNVVSVDQGEKQLIAALPLIEKTDMLILNQENSNTDNNGCELHACSTLQERMLRVFSDVDQRHISPVLREVHDCKASRSSKTCRKKRHEEEAVRSSIRQSECAFRYKEIVVKKHQHYMQVVLVPNTHKQNCLTVGAMKELKEALQSARRDSNCKAILLNSSGSFFCSGIDMRHLCGNAKKHNAEELAVMIRDLILTFAIFPKPVVAAVNGYAIGLGVALLTYCDVVLASDKATFSIPSTHFGYVPEGGVSLTLPQVVGSTVATEMLLYGRVITAEQALKCGLVSEVIWPTKLMEEVVPRMQCLVQQPLQIMEVTKTMVRCHLWEKLAVQLNHEWRILPRQWLSTPCQQKMKQHLQNGWQLY